MKLWGGRFAKETNEMVDEFNACIGFGSRLYEQDILGSIAHATMLGEQNIIPAGGRGEDRRGAQGILADAKAGKIQWSTEAEDIHMNVETILTERIGEAGKRLHTGRSRNDQCVLDTRMYARETCVETRALLDELIETLLDLAQAHLNTVMPGYTHLQRAQPVTLAHYMMAYVQMFLRDRKRFQNAFDSANVMPLGSGALAATTYPLNRQRVAELLDFPAITQNSLDGVSDRDFILDYLSAASICMMHLSRFCEELILWSSPSSILLRWTMRFPQAHPSCRKRKPGRRRAAARQNRPRLRRFDCSADGNEGDSARLQQGYAGGQRALFFDARDTLLKSLPVFTAMLRTMTFREDIMEAGAAGGFTNATDCADYLVKKGVAFRDAHRVVGELVAYCIKANAALTDLSFPNSRRSTLPSSRMFTTP